jgi:hypothetical protein
MTCTDARRGRRAAIWLLAALFALIGADAAAAAKAPTLKLSKLTGAPATLAPGDAFTVSVTVKNTGKRKTKAQPVSVALTKLKLSGTVKVKALAPRKSATVKGKVTVPKTAAAGSYKLTACIGKACTTGAAVTIKGTQNAPAPAPPARPSGETVNLPPGPAPLPGNPDPTPTPDPGTGDPDPTPTPDPVVRDPKDAAPALDPGAATSVYDSSKFLYSGANPIQRDVAPGAIEPKQVAVLKGRVQDRAGTPIGGVRVTVLDHPELGETNTRADGAFDIAVNGGGITLSFVVAGFLPVQRTLSPSWQDYETLDDVVMVPVDPNVKTIDPDSTAPFQVVRGTESEDKDGERQGTLLFPKGVNGSMELPSGRAKPLDELKVRVTEFTYGEQGDEAMPGSLPANSGYTYAAEFSVDAALAAGASQVNFDKPLINYTENFIGAPIGSAVPTGYYDRETAEWKGAKDGRVIKVLSEAGGIAAVDTDGDGKADTGLGMTDDERKQLASLYEPGHELWRVLITHFTPWDHNWPYGPPPGARPPQLKEFEWKDPNDPCQQKGSAIGCETQTLQESVPQLLDGPHPGLEGRRDDPDPGRRPDRPAAPEGRAADDRRRWREDREALVRPELPDHRDDHLQGLSAGRPEHQLPVQVGRQGRLRPHGPGPRDGHDPGHLRLRVQLLRRGHRRLGVELQPVRLGLAGLRRPLRVRQPLRHDGHALLLRRPGRPDDHAGDRLVGRAPDARPRRLVAERAPRL